MFKCEKCKKTSHPGESSHRMPVEQREKVYHPRKDENDEIFDKGGSGHEIVSEMILCEACYEEMTNE